MLLKYLPLYKADLSQMLNGIVNLNILDEKNADQNLKLCLLKLFKESEAVQITWIQKLILLKKAPAEGCALVRMFINFGIQNR